MIVFRNNCIRPMDQLLLTLRFYATGKFLISSGDFCNGSKSSASKIIKKVAYAIASLSPSYIQMPQGE
ncbi:hypothetical protein JTB14_018912 [Gonioctena quinquepunctata]|nr:hypothetical protein JTB14_018912 [Gonioctena quinquepunctata]